jgi:hypothetical protein
MSEPAAKRRRWPPLVAAAGVLAAAGALLGDQVRGIASRLIASRQARNDRIVREELAFHVGTLAYVYGYPIVDMAQQMHNETHRVAADQQVFAPVNRMFSYGALVTPATQGNLRLPNHDTLYFSGWYDVSQEPVILHVPDTGGRYYTIAITNFYSEVEHVGRRTTGTAEREFALVPPGFAGALPPGVTPVTVETPRGWLLGRMFVAGEADAPAALALVDEIWLARLSEYAPGKKPPHAVEERAPALGVMETLAYFERLNAQLRELPPRASEAGLIAQLDAIGIGPSVKLELAQLDAETRRGLERALEAGSALVGAASQRTQAAVNGWIVPRAVGRYGFDYLARAVVVRNGYGNLPEESLYAAALLDHEGKLLTGGGRYRIRFEAGALPPVGAFWSLSVYDVRTFKLVENPIRRYSLGNLSPGLRFAGDGSLTIALQAEEPSEADVNWLPTPRGALPFIVVMRMYEPSDAALRGDYVLPPVTRATD